MKTIFPHQLEQKTFSTTAAVLHIVITYSTPDGSISGTLLNETYTPINGKHTLYKLDDLIRTISRQHPVLHLSISSDEGSTTAQMEKYRVIHCARSLDTEAELFLPFHFLSLLPAVPQLSIDDSLTLSYYDSERQPTPSVTVNYSDGQKKRYTIKAEHNGDIHTFTFAAEKYDLPRKHILFATLRAGQRELLIELLPYNPSCHHVFTAVNCFGYTETYPIYGSCKTTTSYDRDAINSNGQTEHYRITETTEHNINLHPIGEDAYNHLADLLASHDIRYKGKRVIITEQKYETDEDDTALLRPSFAFRNAKKAIL